MPWVSLLVIIPFVFAAAMPFVPRDDQRTARVLAMAGALLTLAVSIAVVVMFDRSQGAMQMVDHVDWVQSIGLSWDLGVDGISIWLLLLTTVLFTLGMFAACRNLPRRGNMFLGLLLLSLPGRAILFELGLHESRVRQEAERQQAQFHAAFMGSPVPMTMFSLHPRAYLDVNPAWESLTGYRRADVLGDQPERFGLFAHHHEAAQVVADLARGLLHRRRRGVGRHHREGVAKLLGQRQRECTSILGMGGGDTAQVARR